MTYFDTSVIIAAVVQSHPAHGAAHKALMYVRAKAWTGCISTHGLAEAYAVLLRLPLRPAVHPAEASQILTQTVLPLFRFVALGAEEYKHAIQQCAERGWRGGGLSELLHVEAARSIGCADILTLDVKHFRELAPDFGHRIREP